MGTSGGYADGGVVLFIFYTILPSNFHAKMKPLFFFFFYLKFLS